MNDDIMVFVSRSVCIHFPHMKSVSTSSGIGKYGYEFSYWTIFVSVSMIGKLIQVC